MQLFFEESVASDPTNNFMTLVFCGAETDHIPDNKGNVWWYDHYQVGRNSYRFPSTNSYFRWTRICHTGSLIMLNHQVVVRQQIPVMIKECTSEVSKLIFLFHNKLHLIGGT